MLINFINAFLVKGKQLSSVLLIFVWLFAPSSVGLGMSL